MTVAAWLESAAGAFSLLKTGADLYALSGELALVVCPLSCCHLSD